MQILVSGASGLVGSALVEVLKEQGHSIQRLVRKDSKNPEEVYWNYARSHIDSKKLIAPDVVIHLAGENVASGPWFANKKREILRSRAEATRFLAEFFAESETKPSQIICASAIGIYGDAGDKILTEESEAGEGFLAEVVKAWEAALEPARNAGIATLHVRIGLVLSEQGGILAKMMTPFKLGLGGRLGSGQQYMSWISREDLVRIFIWALDNQKSGVLNAVSPNPVTNAEFTKSLGSLLGRPTFLSVPAFVLRSLPGGMGQEMFLASTRVSPQRLLEEGFTFQDQVLEPTLARGV